MGGSGKKGGGGNEQPANKVWITLGHSNYFGIEASTSTRANPLAMAPVEPVYKAKCDHGMSSSYLLHGPRVGRREIHR